MEPLYIFLIKKANFPIFYLLLFSFYLISHYRYDIR